MLTRGRLLSTRRPEEAQLHWQFDGLRYNATQSHAEVSEQGSKFSILKTARKLYAKRHCAVISAPKNLLRPFLALQIQE